MNLKYLPLTACLAAMAFLPVVAATQSSQSPDMTTTATPEPRQLITDTLATGPVALIHTTEGDIRVRLYDDTPAHRDNFLKLVKDGTYDGVLFHRVIKDFMVQTGDINSSKPDNTAPLGTGDPGYTIPAEINYPRHFHKYGALAAARTSDQVNPERRSSGSQFYIVTGQELSPRMLENMTARVNDQRKESYFRSLVTASRSRIEALQQAGDTAALEDLRQQLVKQTLDSVPDRALDPEVARAYSISGGTPHLDNQYTVFGEVLDGMDVVEKIQNLSTDSNDRPVKDVRIISIDIEK